MPCEDWRVGPQMKNVGERLGTDSPLVTSEGIFPCQHRDLGFWAPKTVRKCNFVVQATYFVVLCRSSPSKTVMMLKH